MLRLPAVIFYDLRTNSHFTLKQNPLRRSHLDDLPATAALVEFEAVAAALEAGAALHAEESQAEFTEA